MGATERTLKEEKLAHDVEESRRVADAETRKAVAKAHAALEKEQKQAELLEATEKVRRASLESERRISELRANDEAAVEMIKLEAELARRKKEDERVSALSDKGMALLQMQSTQAVYENTPVTIHSFLGREGSGPASLLPGAEAMMTQAAGWEVLGSTTKK